MRTTTTRTLLDETPTNLLNITERTLTRHLSLQRQYLTSRALLRPSRGYYNLTISVLLTNPLRLRQLLTNVKDKDEPNDRQGAVYKIKRCDYQATYIGETGRNLNTRLTEHKRATRNGDLNNNIAEHHLQTNHRIDWDSAECVIYSTDYYQRLTLES